MIQRSEAASHLASWAQQFVSGPTVVGLAQRLHRTQQSSGLRSRRREVSKELEKERQKTREEVAYALDTLAKRRFPPIRGIRLQLIRALLDAPDPQSAFTLAEYCRQWGQKMELSTASILIDSLCHSYATSDACEERPRTALPSQALHRLQLLQKWLAADGSVPDTIFLTQVVKFLATLAWYCSYTASNTRKHYRTQLQPKVWARGLNEDVVSRELMRSLQTIDTIGTAVLGDIKRLQPLPSFQLFHYAIRMYTSTRNFRRADELLCELRGLGRGITSSVRYYLVKEAAYTNSPLFPTLFIRWLALYDDLEPKYLMLLVVWHNAGAGKECAHCGDVTAHAANPFPDQPKEWHSCPAATREHRSTLAALSTFHDNSQQAWAVLRLIKRQIRSGVSQKYPDPLFFRYWLQMGVVAPRTTFSHMLKQSYRAGVEPHEVLFTRLQHALFWMREGEAASILDEYFDAVQRGKVSISHRYRLLVPQYIEALSPEQRKPLEMRWARLEGLPHPSRTPESKV